MNKFLLFALFIILISCGQESTKKQVVGGKDKGDKNQPSVYQELVKNGHVSPEEEAQIKTVWRRDDSG